MGDSGIEGLKDKINELKEIEFLQFLNSCFKTDYLLIYWDWNWAGENCLFSARFFKPIFVTPHVDCNLRFWILDFGFKEFCLS